MTDTSVVGRVLGIDLGAKRIGVAVCDSLGILASPLQVVARSGDRQLDHRRLAQLAVEEEAVLVVVGLPIDLAGRTAIAAQGVLSEVEELATVVDVPVETHDERMTTAAANKALGGKAAKNRDKVDKVAAALILQSWLDSRR